MTQSQILNANFDWLQDGKKEYFPEYKIKTQKTIYDRIVQAKRSTFDRSKFTVVGTPTITDDGIASGFSGSNYLTINTSSVDWSKPYHIKIKIKLGNTLGVSNIVTRQNMPLIYINEDWGSFKWRFSPTGSRSNVSTVGYIEDTEQVIKGETYLLEAIFDGTTYTFKKNGIIIGSSSTLNTDLSTGGISVLGQDITASDYLHGSIDLSQFSITVDGREVFNGNKTGTDQIKKDDYTKKGSPVITDDGVVTQFKYTEYLNTGIDLNQYNNWKIEMPFIFTNVNNDWTTLLNTLNRDSIIIYNVQSIGAFRWSIAVANGDILIDSSFKYINCANNDKMLLTVEFTGSVYNVKIDNLTKGTYVSTSTSSTEKIKTGNLVIGYGTSNSGHTCYHKIDLNSFKIYVDGNLVYQPTLRIPYIQSNIGAKIVDSVYRDRVEDMYNQFGYTHYYTLGDNNYTLATHKNNDIIDCGSNYEQTADLTLKQWGSCTSGSVVNLLPYKDTNYAVTAPHSAKTESSFTASATGDYIAVGKVVL